MPPQNGRRHGGACKRDSVLGLQVIQKISYAAADELHCAWRQHACVDDAPEGKLGEVGGARCGLHDGRYAGEHRRREFLKHAPHGEVEGVDVHCRAFERRIDVLPQEAAALRQRFRCAVKIHVAIGQFARALACVDEERADTAVDVEPSVMLGRPRAIRELIELLLVRAQRLGETLQNRRPLMKAERPCKIDARRCQLRDDLAVRCVAQQLPARLAAHPAFLDEAFQEHVHVLSGLRGDLPRCERAVLGAKLRKQRCN